MTRSRTPRRPSTLARFAGLLTLLCALLFAPAAEARAGKGSTSAGQMRSAERAGKKSGKQRQLARVSRRKAPKSKLPPVTAPEEPAPAEPTPVPAEPTPVPAPEPVPEPTPEPVPEPTPAPAPNGEPAPAPSTDVLFHGDQIRDFWLNQSAPNAITEVDDPAGSGQKVFKMTVSESDVYPVTPSGNPRAQVLSPPEIEAGDEIWWSSSFYLPGSFPSSVPGWLNLLEGPYGGPFNGSPPWQIQVVGNSIQWTRNKTYSWDVPWKMPLVKEKWIEVVVHERFGADGFVEMWINGQQITFFSGGTYNPLRVAPTTHLNMATMDSSNDGGANMIILQNYRKAGMFSSVTVYEGPLTIGKTRASVAG